MRTINRVELVGNVATAPTFEEVGTKGTTVTRFTLATNRGEGATRETEYHRCVAYGRLAVTVYAEVTKGAAVYVDGRLSYEGGGVEVVVRECAFLARERETAHGN